MVGNLDLEFWREVPVRELNWGAGSPVFCSEVRDPYAVVQTGLSEEK